MALSTEAALAFHNAQDQDKEIIARIIALARECGLTLTPFSESGYRPGIGKIFNLGGGQGRCRRMS